MEGIVSLSCSSSGSGDRETLGWRGFDFDFDLEWREGRSSSWSLISFWDSSMIDLSLLESSSEFDSTICTSLSGLKLGRWKTPLPRPVPLSFSVSLPFDFDFENVDFVTLLLDAAVNVGFDFVGLVLGCVVDEGLDADGRGGLNGFGGMIAVELWWERGLEVVVLQLSVRSTCEA